MEGLLSTIRRTFYLTETFQMELIFHEKKTFFDASFLSWVCLYSCGWRYNRRGARVSALDVPPLCSHLLADAGVGDCEFVPALCSFDALHDRGHETKGTLYLRRRQCVLPRVLNALPH